MSKYSPLLLSEILRGGSCLFTLLTFISIFSYRVTDQHDQDLGLCHSNGFMV